MMVVVKEPGVDIALVQGGLYGFQVHSGVNYLFNHI
jgi:hypothetical protein